MPPQHRPPVREQRCQAAAPGPSEEISFLMEPLDEAVRGSQPGAGAAPGCPAGGSYRVPALGARRLLAGTLAPAGSAVPNLTRPGCVGTQRCRVGGESHQLLMAPTASSHGPDGAPRQKQVTAGRDTATHTPALAHPECWAGVPGSAAVPSVPCATSLVPAAHTPAAEVTWQEAPESAAGTG